MELLRSHTDAFALHDMQKSTDLVKVHIGHLADE
jgi:hypothetical protein